MSPAASTSRCAPRTISRNLAVPTDTRDDAERMPHARRRSRRRRPTGSDASTCRRRLRFALDDLGSRRVILRAAARSLAAELRVADHDAVGSISVTRRPSAAPAASASESAFDVRASTPCRRAAPRARARCRSRRPAGSTGGCRRSRRCRRRAPATMTSEPTRSRLVSVTCRALPGRSSDGSRSRAPSRSGRRRRPSLVRSRWTCMSTVRV